MDLSLDRALSMFLEGRNHEAMKHLVAAMFEQRRRLSPEDWRDFASKTALNHPVREIVHEDPFSKRAFAKPRGYPGDATLIDYIYGIPHEECVLPPPSCAHDPGSQANQEHRNTSTASRPHDIYSFTSTQPAPRAVRFRRQFVANLIDQAINNETPSRFLALAAGHLREIELSKKVTDSNGARNFQVFALDQDPQSLATIRRDYSHLPVETIHASVRDFLRGNNAPTDMDLVYAAGLFDYLPDSAARHLVRRMVTLARPGGKVFFANFLPDIPDVGYMESFMAWPLIYRTPDQMHELLLEVPQSEISRVEVTTDPDDNIVFLVATKRDA